MGYAGVGPRIAVRIRDSLPLRVGDDEASPDTADATFERWRTTTETVVYALRILKPGTVSSPGHLSSGEYLREGRGGTFTPSATPRHTLFESYRLEPTDAMSLRELWNQMNDDRVAHRKALATAIRRFGFAGERSRAEDQIIDLMVAAEALFLPGERGESRHKLSLRAALLLEDATHRARDIAIVMRRAYQARDQLAHGEEVPRMALPDGAETTLEAYVDKVAGYMRRALRHVIGLVAEGNPSPIDDWDAFTFERLSSA